MGGRKSSSTTVNMGPYSIAEPAYTPLAANLGGLSHTTFDSLPGQLDLIAQQIHQGYPSIGQAALLKQLHGIYKPVTVNDPKIAAAMQAASGQTAKPSPASNTGPSTPAQPFIPQYGNLGYAVDPTNGMFFNARQKYGIK